MCWGGERGVDVSLPKKSNPNPAEVVSATFDHTVFKLLFLYTLI